jgi:biotin carboxylase
MLGTVDSIMYPGTDQFQRFQYPSFLAARDLARVDELAVKLVQGLGFTHGMFNIEMRIDPQDGALRVIEINPRAAGQFYDLFERVDGYNLLDALIALECGDEPAVRRREGRQKHAASFVLRDLVGEGLSRWPARGELAALKARHADAHVMFYPKRGADLAREMKWLGSYRYGVFNLGGDTLEEMFGRFHRICSEITFHPAGHRTPDLALLLAGD